MKVMEVMGYIGELRLCPHRFSSLCLIVSVVLRILITFQEKELIVRTETASSSSGSSRALNTLSSKKHFGLFPLLFTDTSYNILRDIPTT